MSIRATTVVLTWLRAPGATLTSLWGGTRWARVLTVVALLVLHGFAFEPVGFIPCTLALLLVLTLFVDPIVWWPIAWWQALLISFSAVFGV